MDNGQLKESLVLGQSTLGGELRGTLLRVTRYTAAFEVYQPSIVLQVSEVLSDFRIICQGRALYSGRAVISGVVHSGSVLVCEVKLDEAAFSISTFSPADLPVRANDGFEDFFSHWQKIYRVLPEFKVAVADMQTFLTDLRLWLDQLELEIRSAPSGSRLSEEQSVIESVGKSMVSAFDAMHEQLEFLGESIPEELRAVHQNFCKRQLHPLMLCSPFGYRTYSKPLGYAGDYEMVNMIVRSPYEGSSLFAKAVNLWFLSQWPARAHRNRIQLLKERIREECLRGHRLGRPMRILNLGCGPAREIQEFLAEDALGDYGHFTLLDFNEETLQHAAAKLEEACRRYGRRAQIELQRKSVRQFLKDGGHKLNGNGRAGYDLIYCAGLFDYLSDRTCRQLMDVFYDSLRPEGLLLATNVDACKPFRHMLEFVLEWHLVYRTQKRGESLLPAQAPRDAVRFVRDPTMVNLFIEVRKPGP